MAKGEASHPTNMSTEKHFAVCIQVGEYEGALELRKIYEILEDSDAEPHDLIRVIDESGEDYLYPHEWFLPIELPQNVEQAIAEIVHAGESGLTTRSS
jgi:hypothetical protein